ncbi:hypothetical protein NPS01_06530 [Nocardioides psychrotolerans]|nr:hypothetical protein NPS01_06530 [Nocardioides psychrotolerans]
MHDPHPVLVEEAIELGPERSEAAGLDLDQLSVGAHQVDHPPPDRHLERIARPGEPLLHRCVERPLRELPDPWHAAEPREI